MRGMTVPVEASTATGMGMTDATAAPMAIPEDMKATAATKATEATEATEGDTVAVTVAMMGSTKRPTFASRL